MEINTVLELKKEMESKILEAIVEFQRKTDQTNITIEFNQQLYSTNFGGKQIISQSIKADVIL